MMISTQNVVLNRVNVLFQFFLDMWGFLYSNTKFKRILWVPPTELFVKMSIIFWAELVLQDQKC